MKVIFANNYYYLRGGSERVFFDEIQLLEENGHVVAPFTRTFEKNFPSKFANFFLDPIEYENVSFSRKIRAASELIYSSECRRRAGALIDQIKPDLIHCHNIYGRLTTGLLDAARQHDVPVVMTLHDYKLVCPAYLMLRNGEVCGQCQGSTFFHCVRHRCHKGSLLPSLVYTAEAYLARFFDKYRGVRFFACPSRFILAQHREIGIAEDRLVHLPNFIHIDSFAPDYEPGSYVLYAGRLSHEKGVQTLLAAMCGLSVPLKIVGDGPLRAELEAFVADNSLENVEFLGYRTGDELKRLFSRAAFLVFPSEWNENAPMTILEAFASGKPVIGSRIGGTPEMVREGESGLLFEPGNADSLRDAIVRLFSNSEQIVRMGKNARQQVEAENSEEYHYARLMEVYDRASAHR